jgi:uncharacterized protein
VTNIRFTWDPAKNRANKRKHGVNFEQASQVFFDPLRVSQLDQVVDGEERWQTFGIVDGVLLLMVAHTTWDEVKDYASIEVIRVISARKTTPMEREIYEEGR